MKVNLHNLFAFSFGLALAFVGTTNLIYKFFDLVETRSNWEFPYWEYGFNIQIVAAIFGLVLGAFWSIKNLQSEKSGSALELIIFFNCLWLAFFIAHAGNSKVLDAQFNVPEQIKDMPLMEVHPGALTWYYFGLFYEYGLIIGITQILGSVFLLFGRTRLLGVIVLIPVMLNIVLANHFFQINKNAYVAAAFFTIGLIYLLLLDYKILIEFFLKSNKANNDLGIGKNLARIVIIVGALFIRYLFVDNENGTFLKGVYAVENINSTDSTLLRFQPDNNLLSKIYFEYYTTSVATLEFESHRKRIPVQYRLDTLSNGLTMEINGSLMQLTYDQQENNIIKLIGHHNNSEISFDLKKIRDSTK
jgi:hypothetical protein